MNFLSSRVNRVRRLRVLALPNIKYFIPGSERGGDDQPVGLCALDFVCWCGRGERIEGIAAVGVTVSRVFPFRFADTHKKTCFRPRGKNRGRSRYVRRD